MKHKVYHRVRARVGVLLLFVLMLAGINPARAQETYGLKIAGVDVTSDNCDDLSVIDGVSGTVKYDSATKTLTLENATITVKRDVEGIQNASIKRLIINVVGENRVIAEDYPAIAVFKATTIQGGGKLYAASENRSGITNDIGSLTIDNCDVSAKGSYGIRGNTGTETLIVKNGAVVTAEGNNGSVAFIKTLKLEDDEKILHPIGAVYNPSLTAITLNGEVIGTKVVIAKSLAYGLKIAGIDVTHSNYSSLTEFTGVSGTVNYDPNTNVLTLDNATIALQGNTEAITNYADSGLVINITGENNITSNQSALTLAQPTTLKGGGTLNATSVNGSGMAIDNTTVTVTPCNVNAKGIHGLSGSGSAILSVKFNVAITAEGSEGSVVGMDSLDLESNIDLDGYVSDEDDGIAIIKPNRAEFDKTLKAVAVNGVVVTEKVLIGKLIVYDMFINGEHVTNANCNDLSVLPGVRGAVIYDPDTYTLTLKNAVLETEYRGWAIRYDATTPNMTIKLLGENHIITYGAPFGITQAPLTVTGGGSLDILSAKAICGANLTFDDCTINIKSYATRAIEGDFKDRSFLTIRNADITAERLDTTIMHRGAISYLSSLVLEGCEIVEPMGAAFVDSLYAVAIDGEPAPKVVIRRTGKKYGFKVAGIDVTSRNCNDLSVIDGVSGTAKYDPETKTLFLDNATIEASGDTKGIDNDTITHLTINVTGDNTIKANHSALMLNKTPTVIKGYGTLNAEAKKGMGVYFGNSLEIDNCTANFNGNWGVGGFDGKTETLTVNNATVKMKGTESSHSDIHSLTLVNSIIATPAGAAFSTALHAIALNGSVVTDSIVIVPDTTKHYDVVLEECPDNKEEVAALVQSITGLGEAESLALVESAPCVICSDVSPIEAHNICHALAKLYCRANNYLHDTWNVNGIKNVDASTVAPRRQGIYSLNGVYLGRDFDSLPKGVYIKDGKKVLK